MKHNLFKKLSILSILLPNFAFAASLGTATTTFTVGTTVKPVCTVSATSLNFGSYDGVSDVTATSTFTMVCDASSTPTWEFDGGANYNDPNRRMSNGSSYLNYNLAQDSGYTIPIAVADPIDTYNGSALVPNPEIGQTFTVYGKIASGQVVDTSNTNYSDTIGITIRF